MINVVGCTGFNLCLDYAQADTFWISNIIILSVSKDWKCK